MGKAAGRVGWRTAALSVVLAVALAAAAAGQAQAVTIHEIYAGLIGTGSPNHIAAGPEGNLWLTGHNEASIDRITPTGGLTEYFLSPNSSPEGITEGPNGKLWFTEPGWDRVGRISPGGALTEFASNGITGQTADITDGPEGDLWFTQINGTIGRITTLGSVTQFSEGITQKKLHSITVGAEGDLWFAEESAIGRITPSGVVTEFSAGITPGSETDGIATGPEGNLWFTEAAGDRIGRITPAGVVTEFSQGISPGSEPVEIAAGPDGNLWFTERAGDRIGRITPAGVVTQFSEGIAPGSEPSGITAGPEDSMWFTCQSGELGQVAIEQSVIEPPKPPTVVTGRPASVTYSSGTLRGTVDPNGSPVSDCHFEYGTSQNYGSSVPCTSMPGGGSATVSVSASLQSLREHTQYHVRLVAVSAGGTSYGGDVTFTTNSVPPPPPTSGMLVGVNAGGWGPEQYADVREAVSSVRVSGCSSNAEFSGWANAGVTVIDDITGAGRCGPYDSSGVSAINIASWVAEAVAQVKANPTIAAVEVLNEPGGEWYWGPEAESTANTAAYASLLKAVHEAFVQEFGSARPLILASYDGGHDNGVSWGEKVWNEATNGGIDVNDYVDGVTVHPYGFGSLASAALGDRATVQAAHAQTGKPVYVTEVGWSTATNLPVLGAVLQFGEIEQAEDIYNFVTWARSTGYVAAVEIFNYRDYGTEDFWGIERWGNPAGPDGSRKPSYYALQAAAAGLPLSLE
jgi:streptogramin lyase